MVALYIALATIPATYDPSVSAIPVAIKTSANSVSLTNRVKCDRKTAIAIKNKQPIKAAKQKTKINLKKKQISTFFLSDQDKVTKQFELNQKELNL